MLMVIVATATRDGNSIRHRAPVRTLFGTLSPAPIAGRQWYAWLIIVIVSDGQLFHRPPFIVARHLASPRSGTSASSASSPRTYLITVVIADIDYSTWGLACIIVSPGPTEVQG
ncbi:MAG: hypothetical protein U0736_21045 [Gemmataceae bacterium]